MEINRDENICNCLKNVNRFFNGLILLMVQDLRELPLDHCLTMKSYV